MILMRLLAAFLFFGDRCGENPPKKRIFKDIGVALAGTEFSKYTVNSGYCIFKQLMN